MIEELLNLVKNHEQWRSEQCINLIPSENIMSPHARMWKNCPLPGKKKIRRKV